MKLVLPASFSLHSSVSIRPVSRIVTSLLLSCTLLHAQYDPEGEATAQIPAQQTLQLNNHTIAEQSDHFVQSSPLQEVSSERLEGEITVSGEAVDQSRNIAFVLVGDSDNQADSTGHGSVSTPFSIGAYDVTVCEYCDFLNAVASVSDPYGLYHRMMSLDAAVASISRKGTNGNYIYAPIKGCEELPITYVTLYSAARFCNWLHHGKPVGEEDETTTETGSYELNGAVEGPLVRNQEAHYFIPNEDEWYKAAYYNREKKNYYSFPTRSYWSPKNSHHQEIPYDNEANYNKYATGDDSLRLTPVGTFSTTMSPYGAFDMGGNVAQWTETFKNPTAVVIRGGSWNSKYTVWGRMNDLKNTSQNSIDPHDACNTIGFRVATSDVGNNTSVSFTEAPDCWWLTPTESAWAGVLVGSTFLAGVVEQRIGVLRKNEWKLPNDWKLFQENPTITSFSLTHPFSDTFHSSASIVIAPEEREVLSPLNIGTPKSPIKNSLSRPYEINNTPIDKKLIEARRKVFYTIQENSTGGITKLLHPLAVTKRLDFIGMALFGEELEGKIMQQREQLDSQKQVEYQRLEMLSDLERTECFETILEIEYLTMITALANDKNADLLSATKNLSANRLYHIRSNLKKDINSYIDLLRELCDPYPNMKYKPYVSEESKQFYKERLTEACKLQASYERWLSDSGSSELEIKSINTAIEQQREAFLLNESEELVDQAHAEKGAFAVNNAIFSTGGKIEGVHHEENSVSVTTAIVGQDQGEEILPPLSSSTNSEDEGNHSLSPTSKPRWNFPVASWIYQHWPSLPDSYNESDDE